ncbi:MAG: universal stress protein [Deltaproteobacteria bacterium]|nr:MAG: universal stress protein [Deltaproteobacteria bacterium]
MRPFDKYNRILVAVDGSETSLHALRESFKLGASWITVLSVAPPYQGDLRLVGASHPRALMTEPCNTALAKAQEMADAAGVQIKTMCEIGEPHERIVDRADAESKELIVLGAKGHSFIERALLGSVTRRVIGYTQRDVLVAPLKAQLGWERILLATDASKPGEAAAARALDLALAYGSELKVVSVMDFPAQLYGEAPVTSDWREMLQDYVAEIVSGAESRNIAATGRVLMGTPYLVISEEAQKEKCSLIIMGSHGRTGLTRLLMGSVTERVIGHAPCPVLVIK